MKPHSRRRRACWAALCGLLVLAGGSVAEAAKATAVAKGGDEEAAPGLYASSVGRSDRGLVVIHYWSRGPLFRSETIIAGHPIITIVNGDLYYILDTLTAIGVVIRRTPEAIAADAIRTRPFANELAEIIAGGGEKVRDEVIAGNEVAVYRLTNESGRRTVWVSKLADRLPLRVETYQRSSGQTGRLDYFNWLSGLPLSDDFFEPPAGVELARFDSYEDYLERMRLGPVPPAPPLFQNLLYPRRK